MTKTEALELIGERLLEMLQDADDREALTVLGIADAVQAVVTPEPVTMTISMESQFTTYDVHEMDKATEAAKIRAAFEKDAAAYGARCYKAVTLVFAEGGDDDSYEIENEADEGGMSDYSYEVSAAAEAADRQKRIEAAVQGWKNGSLTLDEAVTQGDTVEEDEEIVAALKAAGAVIEDEEE